MVNDFKIIETPFFSSLVADFGQDLHCFLVAELDIAAVEVACCLLHKLVASMADMEAYRILVVEVETSENSR